MTQTDHLLEACLSLPSSRGLLCLFLKHTQSKHEGLTSSLAERHILSVLAFGTGAASLPSCLFKHSLTHIFFAIRDNVR